MNDGITEYKDIRIISSRYRFVNSLQSVIIHEISHDLYCFFAMSFSVNTTKLSANKTAPPISRQDFDFPEAMYSAINISRIEINKSIGSYD